MTSVLPGEIDSTYAASFDENDGTFYWKTNGGDLAQEPEVRLSEVVGYTML